MYHTTTNPNTNKVGFTEAAVTATILQSLGTLYAE